MYCGADILRSKIDANEYKDYLPGIVFYKYLSDSFLIKAYDLIYDEKPENLKTALEEYRKALEDESADELKEQIKAKIRYVIEADLLHTDADILRNAYEYLIGQFASETGKKAGEFYTPQAVSKILIRIAISGRVPAG